MRRLIAVLCVCLLAATPALAEKTVRLTFTGDVTLGGEEYLAMKYYSFITAANEHGLDFFLANFKPLFEADDLTVVNLESVLSDSAKGENKGKTYRFRAPSEYVRILSGSGVDVANIANNHIMDYGTQGYESTLAALSGADIGVFGYRTVFVFEKDGIKIAFFGLNCTVYSDYKDNREWAKAEIARLKSEEGVNAVVFVFHAGGEYSPYHNNYQETYGHVAVDAGADLVIMHHPHVVQGLEVYGNRTVCYSLGNFCFGGNKFVRAMEALVVGATLTFSDEGEYLGQQITLYPAHISATEPYNNYQPLLVSGKQAQGVMRLIQKDTDFTLTPYTDEAGCAAQPYLPAN